VIQEDFEQFHRRNPWVYGALRELTADLVQRGRRRIGVGMLFEVLRWQVARGTFDAASDFKLNNNYRSRYARLLDIEFPGVFEMRELKS
jgi:hypothetical protein